MAAASPVNKVRIPISAAIIASEFDAAQLKDDRTKAGPRSLRQLVEALEKAGFSNVTTYEDSTQVLALVEDPGQYQLADALKGKGFILLDEWIGGRSAFEVHTVLKAAPELADTAFGLLLTPEPSDINLHAAWAAGIDMCLAKPFNVDELIKFSERIRISRTPT